MVREVFSPCYRRSLSCIRPELAMMYLYRVLVSQVTIVKRCDIALVPVPSAAPICSARETAYEPSPGQGSCRAGSDECRARPSTRVARMVSWVKG